MTVKVMLLKSGEDVISDAKEIMDTEKKGIVAYHLSNPFVMQLTAEPSDELQVEGEDAPRTKYSVKYTHWAPLSKQRSFVIPADWLVTIYDPHDNILKDYCLKNNIELESDKESPMAPPPVEVPETTVEAA